MSKLKLISNWISGSVALVFGIVSLAIVVYIGYNQSAQASCVSAWADQYTTVANARAEATKNRLDALHKLFFDLINDPNTKITNQDQVAFVVAIEAQDVARIRAAATKYADDLATQNPIVVQDVIDFQRTEAAYQDTILSHPLPESPKFVCDRRIF